MRTIKELLQVMLDNQQLFEEGLCKWIIRLFHNKLITATEFCHLTFYVRGNRPSKFSSIDAWQHRDAQYYWKFGDIKPRIKWIKQHIKKLS